jgi:hypothetical protein
MDNLLALSALILLGWFWLDSLRAREIATGIGRAACERRNLQFLDQTVSLYRLGVRRRADQLRWRRVYRFDFSEEGVGRHTGYLILVGLELEELTLGLPQHPSDA